MFIHKLTAAVAVILLLISGLTPTLAQTPELRVGDGAPIPFLQDGVSRLIAEPLALPGITGKADISWQQTDNWVENKQAYVAIQVQNIALTDDVLAIFYRAEYPEHLPLAYGKAQLSYDWALPHISLRLEGTDYLPTVESWREGRPDGERAVIGVAIHTLEEPIADGAVLLLGPDKQPLRINRSQMQDPTRAYTPNQSTTLRYQRYEGRETEQTFTVKRVSFGPFGNRLLIVNLDKGRDTPFTAFRLRDDAGHSLPVRTQGTTHSTLSSAANPVTIHNDLWFYGGENAGAIDLVPIQTLQQNEPLSHRDVLPLDGDFPATIMLKDGSTVTVETVHVDDSGFHITYLTDTEGNSVSFYPGDAEGKTLENKLFYSSHSFFDQSARTFRMDGMWMAEYKGTPVVRANPEDIKALRTLLISSFSQLYEKPMPELAVRVPLK